MHANDTHFDQELDAQGFVFPLPIWKTEKALAEMPIGQVLKLIASCHSIAKHMQQFAEQTGHTLLSASETNGVCVFYIQKNTANISKKILLCGRMASLLSSTTSANKL